jgi:hypothetical protein
MKRQRKPDYYQYKGTELKKPHGIGNKVFRLLESRGVMIPMYNWKWIQELELEYILCIGADEVSIIIDKVQRAEKK